MKLFQNYLNNHVFFLYSDYTQAKYQEVLKNSGLLHINGEVNRMI
jgi:hypothetical protein